MIFKEPIVTEKWGRCLQLKNGQAEVIISLDFGPRILSFRTNLGENVFFEDPGKSVYVDDEEIGTYYKDRDIWYNYGGHRLWINPEKLPETYHPDTDQVDYELTERGAILKQAEQIPNKIALQMELELDDSDAKLKVIHKVTNTGKDSKLFAIWAISPMAPGGIEIIPMGKLEDGALPNRLFCTWPYTDLSDSRLYIGKEYMSLKQEPGNTYAPVNLGYNNPERVAGYLNKGTLFVKRFEANDKGNYSDMGVAFETFSNEAFLEVESLGELKSVAPGEMSMHVEQWELKDTNDTFGPQDEEAMRTFAEKYL